MALAVRADRIERLSRLVEGALGWPVVALDDPVLPPVAVLTDVATAGRPTSTDEARLPGAVGGSTTGGAPVAVGGSVVAGPAFVRAPAAAGSPVAGPPMGPVAPGDPPVVLLVDGDDPPHAAAAAGAGAVAILPWPPTVTSLRRAVLDRSAHGAATRRDAWCTVAGAAGGVGATTVALALGGIRSWRAGRTLVAVSGPAHVPDAPLVGGGDLASPAAWAAGASVAGLADLRVVALRRDHAPVTVGSVPTVVELGVATRRDPVPAPDVLVVGRDRAGLAAVEETTVRAVVAVGGGPVAVGRIRRAAAPAPTVVVGRDPRVAAACHAGRHPTDAPGAWLRPLAAVLAAVGGRHGAGAAPVDAA